jgi:hypothetical protein
MKVEVLLADKGTANPVAGTLNLLNVGWKQTTLNPGPLPGPLLTAPHALAIFYEVEPHRCNRPIELVAALFNEDGQPAEVPTPAGSQQVRIAQMITVNTPGGAPVGYPGTGNTLIEMFPGLPLTPGGYRWQVEIDGEQGEDWFASFRVAAHQSPQQFTFGRPITPGESNAD